MAGENYEMLVVEDEVDAKSKDVAKVAALLEKHPKLLEQFSYLMLHTFDKEIEKLTQILLSVHDKDFHETVLSPIFFGNYLLTNFVKSSSTTPTRIEMTFPHNKESLLRWKASLVSGDIDLTTSSESRPPSPPSKRSAQRKRSSSP